MTTYNVTIERANGDILNKKFTAPDSHNKEVWIDNVVYDYFGNDIVNKTIEVEGEVIEIAKNLGGVEIVEIKADKNHRTGELTGVRAVVDCKDGRRRIVMSWMPDDTYTVFATKVAGKGASRATQSLNTKIWGKEIESVLLEVGKKMIDTQKENIRMV